MLLLAATSAFGWGENAGVLLSSVVYTVSVVAVPFHASEIKKNIK